MNTKLNRQTDKCVLLFASIKCLVAPPVASGYCRARGNQIVVRSSENETVLGSSMKLRGAAKHLFD